MIRVRIVRTTHLLFVGYSNLFYIHWAERKRHTSIVATIGEALKDGNEKSIVGRKFWYQLRNYANSQNVFLIYSFKLYICQDPIIIAQADSAHNSKKNALRACLAQLLSAFTSMRGTDTAARAAVKQHPEDGAKKCHLTENCSSENRILFKQTFLAQWGRAEKRFSVYLYQVDVQTKHAKNVKLFNSKHKTQQFK